MEKRWKLMEWWTALWQLFFPPHCAACGAVLVPGEQGLCVKCHLELPRTDYQKEKDNPTEKLFWGKIRLERASSHFYYRKSDSFRSVVHQLKYDNRPDLGLFLGNLMAAELAESGFFDGIDLLMPVPLHPRKKLKRGYNQSEQLARGVAQVTGLPVNTTAVVRRRYTDSQTRKQLHERWQNMEGSFSLIRPDEVAHKHVLLIDDVLTTGATLSACLYVLQEVEGIRLSVLTLGVAG
ncbi:MAG: ComF family protein [Bacteroides sp.]|nr:ComF family protein [Bacteroides sp.]